MSQTQKSAEPASHSLDMEKLALFHSIGVAFWLRRAESTA